MDKWTYMSPVAPLNALAALDMTLSTSEFVLAFSKTSRWYSSVVSVPSICCKFCSKRFLRLSAWRATWNYRRAKCLAFGSWSQGLLRCIKSIYVVCFLFRVYEPYRVLVRFSSPRNRISLPRALRLHVCAVWLLVALVAFLWHSCRISFEINSLFRLAYKKKALKTK